LNKKKELNKTEKGKKRDTRTEKKTAGFPTTVPPSDWGKGEGRRVFFVMGRKGGKTSSKQKRRKDALLLVPQAEKKGGGRKYERKAFWGGKGEFLFLGKRKIKGGETKPWKEGKSRKKSSPKEGSRAKEKKPPRANK